jgi:hypothetical protein
LFDEGFSASTTPVRKVALYPYPDQAYIIPYSYITNAVGVTSVGANVTSLSSDTDEPIVPLRYRHAIIFHALQHWYRDKKDDVRSDQAKAEYTDIMMRIVADHDRGTHAVANLHPQVGLYTRTSARPYRYRGGVRYDTNGLFDEMR